MSSTSRGAARGRGRGNGQALRGASHARGSSASRGTSSGGLARRGNTTPRAAFGQASKRGSGARGRGIDTIPGTRTPGFGQQLAPAGAFGGQIAKEHWAQRFERLESARQNERKQAVRDGLMADPDKPRSLADAITPVGTCQEMCAEFERVQRVVQADVWKEEADPDHPSYGSMSQEPIEAHMVKKFRRAAAGLEEQLPSDLRPPPVLKRTLDYLFEEVIGNARALHNVHGFVWDRTRAIRNDFSIQQCTKIEDLKLAIDCYERIARFHIVSLHQLAVSPKPYDAYDPQQEREQLDRTLLSLVQYYDDVRGRLPLPNEAEFRAYCVIKQLQDPTPDLEDRVQCWPREILHDRRVRTAMDLYAAACNAMDSQGPLKPRATHLVAQQDWQKFWQIISSPKVSYLMACVAEIYFNLVRRTVLNALWRAFNSNPRLPPSELTVEFVAELMKFDDEDQVRTFCEGHGFSFADGTHGEYLDISSVKGTSLPSPDRNLPKQWKSSLVEDKKFGRVIPAIVNGLPVRRALESGLIEEDKNEEDMEDVVDETGALMSQGVDGACAPVDDGESLFLPEADQAPVVGSNPFAIVRDTASDRGAPSFAAGSVFTFGQPSRGTFGKPSDGGSIFNAKPAASTSTFGKPSGGDGIFSKSAFAKQSASDSIFTAKHVAPSEAKVTWDSIVPKALHSQAEQTALGSAKTGTPTAANAELPKFISGAFSFDDQSAATPAPRPSALETPTFTFGTPGQSEQTARSPLESDNEEASSTQTFPWAAQGKEDQTVKKAAAGLLDASENFNASSQTLPTIVGLEQSPNDMAATSFIGLQTSKSEAKQSQFHFTPAASSTTSNPSPATASSPTSPTQQLRKPSTPHNKPNRPSPLANSFTFEDVSNPTAFSPSPPKQRAERPVSVPQIEDLDAILSRVAREFTLEGGGIVDQYISYTVEKLIKTVKDEVELEQDIRAATEYRRRVLAYRYFNRWKSVFWARRFEQRGNKRRARARQGLEKLRQSQLLGDATRWSVGSVASSIAKSMDSAHYRASSSSKSQHAARKCDITAAEQQAHAGGKRPLSHHRTELAAPPRENGSKRLMGFSHVDDRGRIAKPAPTASPANFELLRRSSYLGFSGHSRASEGSSITTRDPYFRLKAMGIKSQPGVGSRGLKRRHEDEDEDEDTTASRSSTPVTMSRTSFLLRSSLDGKSPDNTMLPSALPASANSQSITRQHRLPAGGTEDDALFDRLRAARAALNESTTFMKAEVDMAEEARRSMSASESSNESPSMARARAEVRWRASHAGSRFAVSATKPVDVPAYRLRESRFVPREQYGRAIERASELRASRSRETSRAQSRTGSRAGEVNASLTTRTQSAESHIGMDASSSAAPSVKSPRHLSNFKPFTWQSPPPKQDPTHSSSAQAKQSSFSFPHMQESAFDTSGLLQGSPSATFDSQNSLAVPNGFQSALGSTQKLFSTSGRPSSITNRQDDAAEKAKHEFTIPARELEQSLRTSFGSSQHLFVKSDSPTAPPAKSRESQQAVYQESNSIGPRVDEVTRKLNEEVIQPSYAASFAQQPRNNGFGSEQANEELLGPSADERNVQNLYMDTNPFSLLSNEAMDGDTEGYPNDVVEETAEFENGDEVGFNYAGNGCAQGSETPGNSTESDCGYADEDISEVDDEEVDESDEDIERGSVNGFSHDRVFAEDAGYDKEYDGSEQGSEDEMEGQHLQGARFWNQPPAKNEALQDVGQTEADAIELDSD